MSYPTAEFEYGTEIMSAPECHFSTGPGYMHNSSLWNVSQTQNWVIGVYDFCYLYDCCLMTGLGDVKF
jgi:hypothetical protein